MADKVVDMEVDKMVEKADMRVAMAANMVACMEVRGEREFPFPVIPKNGGL